MARYKHYDYSQMKMLPVSFAAQILPGTFEHTLNRLVDEDFDLSVFEARYKNDEAGLIGREMFAVDGVKMPSNASKAWSGTREDFGRKVQKMERAVRHLVKRHREADAAGESSPIQAAREKQIDTLKRATKKVKAWLSKNDDKPGATGRPRKSNLTDNESAKMKTSKGVIQGYDGVAMVDARRQVVVHAEAYGEAQEHALLVPMLEGTRRRFEAIGEKGDVLKKAAISAGCRRRAPCARPRLHRRTPIRRATRTRRSGSCGGASPARRRPLRAFEPVRARCRAAHRLIA